MTKEITKSIILQELQDKLKLREFIPGKFLFDETVVPVYDIASHLARPSIETKTMSVTAGPQLYLFYTVPQNEEWTFHAYNIVFMATGAYKVTGLYFRRDVAARYLYLDMTKGQTASYAVVLPHPITLRPGNKLYVYVDEYTSTADLELNIDVTKEEIR